MALPETTVKLQYYALRMVSKNDECYTFCEARSAEGARKITEQAWGSPWRAIAVFPSPEFHIETDAETKEEAAALLELRRQNLIRANQKAIMTPDGEFPSIKHAAEHYGITPASLRKRMQSQPADYYHSHSAESVAHLPEFEDEDAEDES